MAKNPLIIGLASLVPNIIQTVASVIKDKKEKKDVSTPTIEPATSGEAIVGSVKDIFSGTISTKRVMNLGATTLIIFLATTDISANGITKLNLALIALGIAYSIAMSFISWLTERK